MGNNLNPPKARVISAERRAQAMQLAKDGNNYAEIARHMGCSRKSAWKMVQKALLLTILPVAEDVRKLELARLDDMWRRADAVFNDALEQMDEPKERVDAMAKMVATKVRIMERRAGMIQVDVPKPQPVVQVVVNQAPERPNLSALNPDELRMMRQMQAKMLAASDENAIVVEAEVDPGA